ncbi:MAG: hypothetical protein JST80_08900 [Bdellovibrionales bacterium]|nr:hypothetical protein [Bdellovibrionales bacterium]
MKHIYTVLKSSAMLSLLGCLQITLSPTQGWAQSTGGGGTGYHNRPGDEIQLQDLVSSAVCDPRNRTTDAVMQTLKLGPKVDAILAATFELHPYMGYLIRQELASMTWCLSQKHLRRVQTEDSDSVFAGDYLPKAQLGIRDIARKIVYLDMPNIKKMREDHVAMTLIHEVMHSFLSPMLPRRNDTLRDVTHSMYDIYQMTLEKSSTSFEIRRQQLDRLIYMAGLGFGTSEFGLAFGRTVQNPTAASEADLSRLTDGWRSTSMLKLIVNELGQAKLAGRIYQLGHQVFLNTNSGREAYLASVKERLRWCTLGKHLKLERCIPRDWFQSDEDSNVPLDFGACHYTSWGSVMVDSAGFMSNAGFKASVQIETKLTWPGGGVQTNYDRTVRNHSILFFVQLGESFPEKLAAAFRTYDKDYQQILQAVLAGHCDIPNSPYRKFFR